MGRWLLSFTDSRRDQQVEGLVKRAGFPAGRRMWKRQMHHRERHRSERIGWLRAAVLGANDGIVSTASLVLGVAAGGATRSGIVIDGDAGVVRQNPISLLILIVSI